MRTKTIDGHTFCTELLTPEGWVIDAGCRGFNLPTWMASHKPRLEFKDFNYNTYCLDIEKFDKPGGNIVTVLKNAALAYQGGYIDAYFFGNGTANFLKCINDKPYNGADRPCETRTVECISLNDVYHDIGTNIDLLKLDIEGAEYEIMMNMEPIPKQISVEFHEHTVPSLHAKYIDAILERLHKWYNINLYIREWPRYKFMDCLFIRKDLI